MRNNPIGSNSDVTHFKYLPILMRRDIVHANDKMILIWFVRFPIQHDSHFIPYRSVWRDDDLIHCHYDAVWHDGLRLRHDKIFQVPLSFLQSRCDSLGLRFDSFRQRYPVIQSSGNVVHVNYDPIPSNFDIIYSNYEEHLQFVPIGTQYTPIATQLDTIHEIESFIPIHDRF